MASRVRTLASRAAIVVATLGGAYSALAVTIGEVSARGAWETALRWWPSGRAEARAAAALADSGNAGDERQSASAYALAALERSPLHAPAARILGQLARADNRPDAAAGLYDYSYAVSRRDTPTYLYLVERAGERRDTDALISIYEHMLRTSNQLPELLITPLVQATADPQVVDRLAPRFAQRPPWWHQFAQTLAARGPSAAAIVRLLAAARLQPSVEGERQILAAALTHLVQIGSAREAYALYTASGGANALLRNGDFEHDGTLPPFDWQLVDEPDLAAFAESSDGGSRALHFMVRNARTGMLAGQLLLLNPGTYRLAYRTGGTPEGGRQILLSITCPGTQERQILSNALPADTPPAGAANQGTFSVPQDCPFQWLAITAPPNLPAIEGTAWIDDLKITPAA